MMPAQMEPEQRWLITGATGFVGSVVSKEAAARGFRVIGVSRRAHGAAFETIDWTQGADAVARIMERHQPHFVFHAAGSSSVGSSMEDPGADFQASVGTWAALLEGVRRSGLRPVIVLPSSAAVYGNPVSLPVPEGAPLRPVSPYGWHKLMAETLALSYADTFGITIIIARLFSVLGGRQRRLLAFELFERLARESGPLRLMGTGRETRDFLDADDLGAALVDLAMIPQIASPLIVNVASGAEISTLALAQHLVDMCAPGREVTCQGLPRPGDPLRWRADVSQLKALLPERRWTPIPEALHKAIALWRTPA